MKKIDGKNGKKVTYFPTEDITMDTPSCPICGRSFKDRDKNTMKNNGKLICPKCSSRLIIKF